MSDLLADGGGVPSGAIVMWSGATDEIPAGWTLCDGTDDAPDLTDRFVAGAGGQYAPGDTGGADAVQLTTAEIPSHDHSSGGYSTDSDSHSHGGIDDRYRTISGSQSVSDGSGVSAVTSLGTSTMSRSTDSDSHSHDVRGTSGDTGGDESHENRPPFYALAYIMRL